MKILIAGATGAIGAPLAALAVSSGHEVYGTTHSSSHARDLEAASVIPVEMDAFDFDHVRQSVRRIQPHIVIEEWTSLPKEYTPSSMRSTAERQDKIRRLAGANLQSAAKEAGVRRYIAQSGAFFLESGIGLADERAFFDTHAPPAVATAAATMASVEARVLRDRSIGGIVLRYGFFYGPGTWYAVDGSVAQQVRDGTFPVVGGGLGIWSFVHVEDAAKATLAAALRGQPGIYHITDDEPVAVGEWLPAYAQWLDAPAPETVTITKDLVREQPDATYYAMRMRGASNRKARKELGFQPRKLEWLIHPNTFAVANSAHHTFR